MNSRERTAEKRRAKLQDVQESVQSGSLTIREMTSAERERFGIGDPDRPHRRFFLPGTRPGTRRSEDEYQRLGRAVRKEVGHRPTARRVFRIDVPIDGELQRVQVGEPSPVDGDVVSAIFELHPDGELVVSTVDDAVALRLAPDDADVLDFV